MYYVGVDGCPKGWVAAGLTTAGQLDPVTRYESFADLIAGTASAELVLIDIPIGLRETGVVQRTCDDMARALVRDRRSSVFTVPVRAAVHAQNYNAAKLANQERTTKMISKQTWGICDKISAVDIFLRANPGLQQRVRETHPEVCFAALNHWQPLPSKKTKEGQRIRLEILLRYASNAETILNEALHRFWRYQMAQDDILDAMAAAVTAQQAASHGIPTVPAQPPTDDMGLRMEIVCPLPPPAS